MILFTSSRPLERAENLKAVWDAYDGEKRYAQIDPMGNCPEATSAERDGVSVIVTDEFLKTIDGKDRCKVIHIGHAISGGKTYGLSQKVRYYTPEQTAQIDYFIATSEECVSIVADQAGIPEWRVLPYGMPRTDWYFGKSKGDGGTELAGGVAYLFAPSFRAGYEPKAPRIDWPLVDSLLSDRETVYVKRHMLTRDPLVKHDLERVVELSPDIPSAPFIVDCDVLATDYSAIIADGYVCNKPGVLYCPDRDAYVGERGMSLSYPRDYCSLTAENGRWLVANLRVALQLGMGPVERRCRDMMAGACDGHSTERVIDLVRSLS